MKILFMGTPDFAAGILECICGGSDEVIAAVTQPDKPHGRGYELKPPAVKVCALEKGIPVYQPETLKDEAFLPTLKELDPELIIVAAYGKILPSYILDYPKHGCINVHGSILPKYRGAAPIQRAIIDGENETGITIMKMEKGLDTGDMLLVERTPITTDDNFETVHDKLVLCANKAIMAAIELIREDRDVYEKQDDTLATYAEKITKADCLIDFNKSAKSVHDLIRGLSPFPLSYAYLGGKMIKFTSSVLCEEKGANNPELVGTIIEADPAKGYIKIACKEGSVGITGVLPEGKKRMSAAEFIRGKQSLKGEKFVPQA